MDGMGMLKLTFPSQTMSVFVRIRAKNWPPNSLPQTATTNCRSLAFESIAKKQWFWIICPNNAAVKDTSLKKYHRFAFVYCFVRTTPTLLRLLARTIYIVGKMVIHCSCAHHYTHSPVQNNLNDPRINQPNTQAAT